MVAMIVDSVFYLMALSKLSKTSLSLLLNSSSLVKGLLFSKERRACGHLNLSLRSVIF